MNKFETRVFNMSLHRVNTNWWDNRTTVTLTSINAALSFDLHGEPPVRDGAEQRRFFKVTVEEVDFKDFEG